MSIVTLISAVLAWLRAKQSAFFLFVAAGISLAVGFEKITWTEVQIVLVMDFIAAAWAFGVSKANVPKSDLDAWVGAAVDQARAQWNAEITQAALDDTFLTFPAEIQGSVETTVETTSESPAARTRAQALMRNDSA